jgi:catechol 2,3-dioxygenase-like lactoylglutathione lyase family enzyme
MFKDLQPVPTLATADRAKARSFYEDTLGLTVERMTCSASPTHWNGRLFVYESA